MSSDDAPAASVLGEFDRDPPEARDAGKRAALPHTDVGNSKRLVMAYGDSMRFVSGKGWVTWDGRRWVADFGETSALAIAATLPDLIKAEAAATAGSYVSDEAIKDQMAEMEGADRDEARKEILAKRRRSKNTWAHTCGALSRINAALTLARDDCRAVVADFDIRPFRVTAQNGELDLERLAAIAPDDGCTDGWGEAWAEAVGSSLLGFDRTSYATRQLGCEVAPGARAPAWEAFIAKALPNPEMRAYAQRLAGYMLSGRNSAQVAIVLLGPGGNGKSTFANGLAKVLGSYAAACRVEMFLESRAASQGPTPEEAVLPGARVYVASEPEPDATISSSKIKGFTGAERRLAHAKGKDPFEWFPSGVPLISLNKIPRITDESEGMWRRLSFVPFHVSLHLLPPGEQVSHDEMEALLEEEAPGILDWMLRGWVAFRREGLAPPDEAQDLKSRQRALADPVGEFLGECTVEQTGERIQSSHLFKVFEAWAEENGVRPMGQTKFSKTLLDKGYRRDTITGRKFWAGLVWSRVEAAQNLVNKAIPVGEQR